MSRGEAGGPYVLDERRRRRHRGDDDDHRERDARAEPDRDGPPSAALPEPLARLFARLRPRASLAVPVLALLVFGAPMYLGGALAPSVPLWACTACFALVLAGVEPRSLRGDPWVRVALVALGVAALQLLPWPAVLLRAVSPRGAELTAGALASLREDRASALRPLHLDPGNGYALLQYLVGVFAAYLAARRVAYRGHAASLHAAAAHATLWLAVVALVHAAWGLDKVFGVYLPRGAAPPVLSPLLNANHLAAFTGAGAILWLGRAAAAEVAAPRVASTAAAVVCGSVCALSLSRGGVLAALAGLGAFVATLAWLRRASVKRSSQRFFRTALLASAVLAAGAWVGLAQLRVEYATGDLSKLQFMGAVGRALRDHWILGVGPGGTAVAVAAARTLPGDVYAAWAECLPIDLALCFGVPAALALLALGARALWSLRPSPRSAGPRAAAAFCALASLVLHDFGDFALWLGACGYLAATLAGALAGEQALRGEALGLRPVQATRWPAALLLLGCALAAPTTARSVAYLARERATAAANEGALASDELRRLLRLHPADPQLPLAAGVSALRGGDGAAALRHFNRTFALAPGWAQPHAILAAALFHYGHRGQALGEVRLAAGLSDRYHGYLASLLLAQQPSDEDLARTVPDGPQGVAYLRAVALRTRDEAILAAVDGLLRARLPDDLDVTLREAGRARTRGDRAHALALLEAAVRRAPREPRAHLALAGERADAGDLPGAERAVREGRRRLPRERSLAMRLAELLAQRGDAAAMRATIEEVFELTGADVDQRIETYGLLGRLELALRNEGAALAAFERGDAMAYPAHPYLGQVLTIVHRLGDVRRLRDVCNTLTESEQLTPPQRALCAEAERPASPPVAL